MRRDELVHHLDDLLEIRRVPDYGPQGLQIEGRPEVRRVLGLVDAVGPDCVDAALEAEADLVLVHHGVFFGPPKRLVGGYGDTIRRYLAADLNLYAAHLALDAHPQYGNNAQIAYHMGLGVKGFWGEAKGTPICVEAEAPAGTTIEALAGAFERIVGPGAVVQAEGPAEIRRVGVCSGDGSGFVEEAAARGCDAFVTGETSHSHYWDARLLGMHVLWGGHYRTETVGVRALGAHLAERFDLDFRFVDLPTGM